MVARLCAVNNTLVDVIIVSANRLIRIKNDRKWPSRLPGRHEAQKWVVEANLTTVVVLKTRIVVVAMLIFFHVEQIPN